MFVPGKSLQLSIMFLVKAGAYLSGAPLWGRLLASSTNIRLGWKGSPGTSTLAYYENYGRKKFYSREVSRGLYYKTFYGRNLRIFVIS